MARTARSSGEGSSKAEYSAVKTVVYSTLFEAGVSTVSRNTGEPPQLVREVQDAWFAKYHGYKSWTMEVTQRAARLDYVTGLDGRVMVIPRGKDKQTGRAVPKPYVGGNRLIQSVGAAIIKSAMRKLAKTEYFPLLTLQVHDELAGVKPEDGDIGRMLDVVMSCMEHTIEGVHFPVEAEVFLDGRFQGHYSEDRESEERMTPNGRSYVVSRPKGALCLMAPQRFPYWSVTT